jgi:hypothetical protein
MIPDRSSHPARKPPRPPAPNPRPPCTMVFGSHRQPVWNSGPPVVVNPKESFPNYDSHH